MGYVSFRECKYYRKKTSFPTFLGSFSPTAGSAMDFSAPNFKKLLLDTYHLSFFLCVFLLFPFLFGLFGYGYFSDEKTNTMGNVLMTFIKDLGEKTFKFRWPDMRSVHPHKLRTIFKQKHIKMVNSVPIMCD